MKNALCGIGKDGNWTAVNLDVVTTVKIRRRSDGRIEWLALFVGKEEELRFEGDAATAAYRVLSDLNGNVFLPDAVAGWHAVRNWSQQGVKALESKAKS